jgi:hypothetical protein
LLVPNPRVTRTSRGSSSSSSRYPIEEEIRKKRRRRFKLIYSLSERLLKAAEHAREQAYQMPAGLERSKLLKKAKEIAVIHLERWLSNRNASQAAHQHTSQKSAAVRFSPGPINGRIQTSEKLSRRNGHDLA